MSTDRKYNDAEVAVIVECEGLGYAVQYYMSADKIANPLLADAWRRAREALDEIDEILPEYE